MHPAKRITVLVRYKDKSVERLQKAYPHTQDNICIPITIVILIYTCFSKFIIVFSLSHSSPSLSSNYFTLNFYIVLSGLSYLALEYCYYFMSLTTWMLMMYHLTTHYLICKPGPAYLLLLN